MRLLQFFCDLDSEIWKVLAGVDRGLFECNFSSYAALYDDELDSRAATTISPILEYTITEAIYSGNILDIY